MERVEKFFLADDIDNDHKVPILLSLIGQENLHSYDHVWEDRECDDTKVGWETCVERVEKFFLADDIDNDHKVPILLSLIGQENLHSAEGSYT